MKKFCLVLLIAIISLNGTFALNHEHSWIFSAEDNVIKAYCQETTFAEECDFQGIDNYISLNVCVDNAMQLEVLVEPVSATNLSLEWESSNPDVVSVNQSGLIAAGNEGTAEITATTTDGSNVSATWEFTVIKTFYVPVTFNSNEPIGTTTSATSMPSAEKIRRGEKVSKPSDPSLTGYSFGGWYKESSCTNVWNFNTDTVTTDTNLYAKWMANTYTITYKDKDNAILSGAFGTSYPTNHTYDSTTILVNPTKVNYIFCGWFTSSDCTGSPVTSIGGTDRNADFTLYAKWKGENYTITYYNYDGSTKTMSESTHIYGIATTLTTPSRTNSTFLGWYKNKEYTGDAVTTIGAEEITGPLILYAKWQIIAPIFTATGYEVSITCIEGQRWIDLDNTRVGFIKDFGNYYVCALSKGGTWCRLNNSVSWTDVVRPEQYPYTATGEQTVYSASAIRSELPTN